jgi:hypothetical protein
MRRQTRLFHLTTNLNEPTLNCKIDFSLFENLLIMEKQDLKENISSSVGSTADLTKPEGASIYSN